jgi:DNA-directed RNA polymerase specialized sigma24 family protein
MEATSMSTVGAFGEDVAQRSRPLSGAGRWRTTSWPLILAAAGEGESARAALGRLYRLYWMPVYAVIARRRGAASARELTQAFLTELLVFRDDLKGVRRRPGQRFRGWLSAALNNFLKNRWKSEHAGCRDSSKTVAFDDAPSEQLPPAATVAAPQPSAEEQLERARAMGLLTCVLARLRREYCKHAAAVGVDGERRFEAVKLFLPGPGTEDADYTACSACLGLSPEALKQLVHRLRVRFGQLLHEAIRAQVSSEGEVEPFKRSLCEALEVPPPGGGAS